MKLKMAAYAQFVETNVLVKHNIYHELKLTIMDLNWQITWKHPVVDKWAIFTSHWEFQSQVFCGFWWSVAPIALLSMRQLSWNKIKFQNSQVPEYQI